MAYTENLAYSYEQAAPVSTPRYAEPKRRTQTNPGFDVVRGGGLDTEAKRSVSRVFVNKVMLTVALVSFVCILGAIRVALSVATVSTLSQNNVTKSEIATLQDTQDQLRVTHSILSAETRISRIASQNYGMVYQANREVIDVSAPKAQAEGKASVNSELEAETSAKTDNAVNLNESVSDSATQM